MRKAEKKEKKKQEPRKNPTMAERLNKLRGETAEEILSGEEVEDIDVSHMTREEQFRDAAELFVRIGNRHNQNAEAYVREAAAEVEKRDTWIYYNQFGMACQRIEKYEYAVEGYEKAIEKSPAEEQGIIYTNLGQTYFMWNAKDRSDERTAKTIKFLEKAGEMPEALNTLACIYDPNLRDNYSKDADISMEYYDRTIAAYLKKGDDKPAEDNEFKKNVAVLYNNKGVIYGNNYLDFAPAAACAKAAHMLIPQSGIYKRNWNLWKGKAKRTNREAYDRLIKLETMTELDAFIAEMEAARLKRAAVEAAAQTEAIGTAEQPSDPE